MNRIIASESDSNREQVKTYIKYYILTSYKPMMQIYRITSISEHNDNEDNDDDQIYVQKFELVD